MLDKTSTQADRYEAAQDGGLDPSQYYRILKKRWLYLVIPAVLIASIGSVIVLLLPSSYLSEGKILIESQQIPTELVRPTVTATSTSRVEVIEQRLTTRDNLLGIVNKFPALNTKRSWYGQRVAMSGTELLDMMRDRVHIKPIELESSKQQRQGANTAFTVGFEHERPEVAAGVANELVTLILAEDARSRTSRAADTTQFLAREQKRLAGELAAVETQIAEFKKNNQDAIPDKLKLDLATLKADLENKAAIYSPSHPAMKALKQQIATLEKMTTRSTDIDNALEILGRKYTAIQKDLDDVGVKLTIAQRGEALERAQQSERLQVLEQPVLPTTPVKGKKLKLMALVLAAAMASGMGGVVVVEMLDQSLRRPEDLASVIDRHLIVRDPFIVTKQEMRRARRRAVLSAIAAVTAVIVGLAGVHFLWMPLDEVWDKILLRMR